MKRSETGITSERNNGKEPIIGTANQWHIITVLKALHICCKVWHSEDRASWYIPTTKPNEMHHLPALFGKELYMFQTDSLLMTDSKSVRNI